MVKLKDHILTENILNKIDKSKSVDHLGKVSFSQGFDFIAWQHLLQDLIEFPSTIPDSEKNGVVWRALVASGRSGKITVQTFTKEIQIFLSNYFKRHSQRRILITTISLSAAQKLPRIRINNSEISFPKTLNESFLKNRDKIYTKAKHSLHAAHPTTYRWVRVSISDRSDAAAVNFALDSLHFLIGVWNLFYNLKMGIRMTWGGTR